MYEHLKSHCLNALKTVGGGLLPMRECQLKQL